MKSRFAAIMLLTSLLVVVASFVVSASATITEQVVQDYDPNQNLFFMLPSQDPTDANWYRTWFQDWGWTHTFDPTNKVLISASLEIKAWDVDSDAWLFPENDKIYADVTTYLGKLIGTDEEWSISTFAIPVSLLADGELNVWMDIATAFRWVTLGYSKLTVVWDLEAVICIKPMDTPNDFNRRAGGALPVAIYGTDYFDVNDVDPTSVMLGGIAPLRWSFEDVNLDDKMDLALKFSSPEVAALGAVDSAVVGDYVDLTLTGELMDGTTFQGTDSLLIVM